MSQVYYAGPNRQPTTTTEAELPGLLNSGQISLQTLVWVAGWPNWRPLQEGFPHLAPPTPVSPPPPLTAPFLPPPPVSPPPTASAPALAGAPPAVSSQGSARRSHEIEFEILGNEMQIVEVELDPGEVVIAEAGAMNYMDADIQFETKMGDGSNPNPSMWDRLKQVGKRALTGESLFMTHFTNRGGGKKKVAFAAPYPGKVLPMDLSQLGGTLFCQKDAFLCAAYGTRVGIALAQKFGAGLFGGEGFILQKLEGDGLAFVHAGGTIIKRDLRGETVLVDTGCLVAFTPGIEYSIQRAGNLKSMVFGGEGLFLVTLRGHGTVWLQSLPLSKLADRILQNAVGVKSNDSGGLLSGIGNLFES
ncbi:MAG: TIGR00266 family protein [Verrucomicrobiales bacterium]|nr:TIGR00266 family protein [Verrucomicrobiales bacterium]